LQEKLGMGVVFVTHDLGVAGEIADRVAVMYAGKVVEEGPVGALMAGPLHPYAKGLLGATVHAGMRGKRLTTIPGAPPMLDKVPTGCAFAPRCAEVTDACHSGVRGHPPYLKKVKLAAARGARQKLCGARRSRLALSCGPGPLTRSRSAMVPVLRGRLGLE
jgi:oligopeptide/dipeptide ABC transporter ATP-binding protein